jgi:hypothetical protein
MKSFPLIKSFIIPQVNPSLCRNPSRGPLHAFCLVKQRNCEKRRPSGHESWVSRRQPHHNTIKYASSVLSKRRTSLRKRKEEKTALIAEKDSLLLPGYPLYEGNVRRNVV